MVPALYMHYTQTVQTLSYKTKIHVQTKRGGICSHMYLAMKLNVQTFPKGKAFENKFSYFKTLNTLLCQTFFTAYRGTYSLI